MQVVTSENFAQLVQTGKVDEFQPPEPAKAEAKVEPKPDEPKPEQPRDADGQFVSTTSDSSKEAPKEVNNEHAAKTAGDDEEDADLPERARKQIGKKHRLMKEAEEFGKAQYLERIAAEQRADKLQRELEESKAKSRPAQTQGDTPPKAEDFATVAEYTEALTDYKVSKKFEAEKARLEQERQQSEKQQREREFAKRVADVKKAHPDFDEVMESIVGTELDKVHMDVVEYLQESEHGARLTYTLAKEPKTLDRLRQLSPRRFIAELGKLEAQWEKAPEPKATPPAATPAVSRAPAPIAPLDGKSTPVHKDPKDMTFQELREYERQRQANRRR